jgi:hypothetical protein
MREGWNNGDYLIIFSEEESDAKTMEYGISDFLPGYRLVGLRGWDDFLVIDQHGVLFAVPTVPLSLEYLEAFELPPEVSLEADDSYKGKVKWYEKPLIFGGDPNAEENLMWVNHETHAQLVVWWNYLYRKAKAQDGG